MWRNSAGIVLCFQKLSSSVVSGSLLRTTCGKTVPLLYEKITEPFNKFVKPVEVLFVKRSSFSGFMVSIAKDVGNLCHLCSGYKIYDTSLRLPLSACKVI